MRTRRPVIQARMLLCAAWLVCACRALAADPPDHPVDHSTEMEFFVSAESLTRFRPAASVARDEDPNLQGDAVLGRTQGRFHVFADLRATTSGTHAIERLQAGFEAAPDTLLWLGRFQQPASAWNDASDHGQYLQTSITRPYIERWEDDEGLIPQHITGVLVESRGAVGGNAAVEFSAALGAGPALAADGLRPVQLIGSNAGAHRLASAARLAFLPRYFGSDRIALLWAHDAFEFRDAAIEAGLQATRATLDLLGAEFNCGTGNWRVLGAAYVVRMRYDGLGATHAERFTAAYGQVERRFAHHLTAFGRIEPSSNTQNSRWVRVIGGDDDWAYRRDSAGVRWDFLSRQALTVEFSRSDAALASYRELRLQWSAAFP
ncbi:MAG: hypothetical protein KGI55_06385 [Gammaproteobacteria bacterium]|nr:hypothetical protein [Gammaproteobacteria bacterium]